MKIEMEEVLEIYVADKFNWSEYSVFVAVLVASLGIGVYYGFFGNQNKTNEHFLTAGRSMSAFPVAMSLVCTFISAIVLLGTPAEIFYYGLQYILSAISIVMMTPVLAYFYVPVYCDLRLTAAYQYFEWRFGTKTRLLASTFAIVYLIFYMPTSTLGPSLALDQVAGIHYGIIAATTFIVCTIYSSIGGLKAVVWTDTLQAIVMLSSIFLVLGLGIHEVGGISVIYNTAKQHGRLDLWNWDPDPRTRYTIWSSVVADFFAWLALFGATQAQIQRYNSVPSLRAARITLVFNMMGVMTIIIFTCLIGLIMFAKYHNCDPVGTSVVESSDQLVPFFVLHQLGKYSGVPGLLVAGLMCGSLSSVSSALNALSALITMDFVKRFKPHMSEERLALISKLISLAGGILALGLVFIIAIIKESVPIFPFTSILIGILTGPILGIFTLGMFFPWANELGTIFGVLMSLIVSGFVGVGSVVQSLNNNLPNQKLGFGNCTTNGGNLTSFYVTYKTIDWKLEHENDSFLLKLFSISYLYQTCLATTCTLLFGLIGSFIVIILKQSDTNYKKVNVRLLSGPWLTLWVGIFGKKRMSQWVEFERANFHENAKTQELCASAAQEKYKKYSSEFSQIT